MTPRVRDILGWYQAESAGALTSPVRILNHGRLAGTGRMVIFSGGPEGADETLLEEVRAIRAGGGFGSIVRRSSFQRPREEAIRMLHAAMDIYAEPSIGRETAP